MRNIERYFKKNNIEVEHIISVYCKNQKIFISMDSGEEYSSSILLNELEQYLPMDEFVTIRRGTIARLSAILSISDDGVYTMIDGKTFQGRKRFLNEHKTLRASLQLNNHYVIAKPMKKEQPRVPEAFIEKCTILDEMQIAYCIIELVFDENGHGLDFIFRYCNKQMEVLEGVSINDMVNHSFYEIFKNGDKKWLVAYADVALNGVKRTLRDYSPEIGKTLTIYCYQPAPGYCACVLTEDIYNK
ncbi:MAG: LytTR family transcriptional regulator DNA-binding domain-containing protein [Anaeroplasmataceae bacterium]